MKRVTDEQVVYCMTAENAPVLSVEPGESFCVATMDCYSNSLRKPGDVFSAAAVGGGNPATGPVHVKGARPGRVLRVDIERITMRDWAVMNVHPKVSPLGDVIESDEVTFLPIRDGKLVVTDQLALPVNPMIGVIGVAPKGEGVPTVTPDEHGGNLDCKCITAGASVYLPVAVDGALLAMGDLHAVQGDGEVCICAAEVSGEIVASAVPLDTDLPTPCVETPEAVLFLGSAIELDTCEALVIGKAFRFLTRNLRLGANEAARFMSLAGELQVCQVVDPLKTMRFAFAKSHLRALGMGASIT